MTPLHPDTSEAPGDLLAPEPTVRTGALIGYARVSTSGQLLDRQQHALAEAGCLRVFAGKLFAKDAERPHLAAYLGPGDTLVVPSLRPAVPVPGQPVRRRPPADARAAAGATITVIYRVTVAGSRVPNG